MDYTPEQKKAIYGRDKSLLLSAAAGSGKTAVLVERIIELVCNENGPDIDKLLVVTFTKLAASEMRDRIYREINKRIKEKPDSKKLKKQLLLLPSANIKTIHGFCLDFIKNNIHLTNIPINVRIASETDADILKQHCITELLEDKYEESSPEFVRLMDTYGYGRDDNMIINIILSVYNFSMSLANPQEYYNLCLNNIKSSSQEFIKTVFAQIIKSRIDEILADNRNKYKAALCDIENNSDLERYKEPFSIEYSFINDLLNETDFIIIQEKLQSFEFLSLAKFRLKAGTDNGFVKAVRDSFKVDLKVLFGFINISVRDEESDNREILEFAQTIIDLCLLFKNKFETEKLKKGIIDFSDFEHITLSILLDESGKPTDVANRMKNELFEILIDEYQDTNDVQDKIFETLSRNQENLFMVGDVKQSIYKFRQARPEIFIEKRGIYKENNQAKRELILLSNNFRSRCEIIDSVNSVFLDIMKKETAMTDYYEEALCYSAGYETREGSCHKTEVLIFDKSVKSDIDMDLSSEAVMVADSIKEILAPDSKFSLYDVKTKKFRFPKFSDIVILLRSMGEYGFSFYNTLLECGIPITADFSDDLYSTIEVLSISAVLRAIDNPLNDIALLSLLKSPAFNFSENEILEIRELEADLPLYYALEKSKNEKTENLMLFIKEFSELAYTMPLSFLVSSIYKKLKMKEIFSVFKNGEHRVSNLEKFLDIAKSFEKDNYQGLKAFVLYIDNAKNSKRAVLGADFGSDKNTVRLMTIHKSKGLEFPIVYVSGLGKRFNKDDVKAKVIVHPELGMGMDYIDINKRFSNNTLTKTAFKIKIKDELLSEELRVLYVALTRAREKLILSGSTADFEADCRKSNMITETGGINKNTLLGLPNFLSFMLPTILDNKFFDIKVKTADEIPDFSENRIDFSGNADKKFDLDNIFYEYKNINLSQIPAKITVSRANKQNMDNYSKNISFYNLESMDDEYSGSEYGTYFHKMFELLDIEELKKGKTTVEILKKLISEDRIELKEYTDEIIEKISAFFETKTGQELIFSDYYYKERPFLVRIPANEVFLTDCTHPVMLQGTTDCYYVKNNDVTLIDFKTDRGANLEKIRQNYSEQIKLYAYAIEKIENKAVSKKIIYSAQNNIEILF